MTPERVLITGASGFIGSHVARVALAEGMVVHAAVRRRSPGQRLDDLLTVRPGNLTIAEGLDLAVPGSLAGAVGAAPFDAVVHAADGGAQVGQKDASALIRENVANVVELCEASLRHGVRRVVVFGSGLCYASGAHCHGEDEALAPNHPYGMAKALGSMVSAFYARKGLEVVELRPFNVYGPGDLPPRLVPYCIAEALAGRPIALTSGAQARDFVFIGDLVRIALAAVRGDLPAGAYNVATGVGTRVSEVANMIVGITGTASAVALGAINHRSDDHDVLCGNPAKLAALGLAPTTTVQDGLAMTIGWTRTAGASNANVAT